MIEERTQINTIGDLEEVRAEQRRGVRRADGSMDEVIEPDEAVTAQMEPIEESWRQRRRDRRHH